MTTRQDSIKTLSSIAQILQKSKPAENPLAHIVAMVRDQMNVDVCSLYLLQDKTLVLVATDGLDPASVGRVRMGIHEGLTGLAIEKLQPVIVKEASLHPRFKYFPETGEEKFHSFAAVPLLDREKVVGVLTIQTAQPREFTPQEIELLRLIAFQMAAVVQNLVTLEVLKEEREKERKTSSLKGIAVAPGFGVGPAFFLRPGLSPVIVPPGKAEVGGPKEEEKRLREAIRKTSADLIRLEKRLQKKFSKSESDIFYSHRMILSDPSFLKKLKGLTRKKKGAVEAVTEVIGDYILEFEKIEDPHFRERAADLEDLRQRILEYLLGTKTKREQEAWEGVLVAETLVPSDTTRLDPERIRGIVTARGGVTSHAAILARSLGIPAVMGIPGIVARVQPGDCLIVDGNTGHLYINPESRVLREYEKIQEKYADRLFHLQKLAKEAAVTKDGRRIHLEANVGLFSGLQKLRHFGAEGVGLYRTEFPFMVRKKLPSEEEQYELYRKIMEEVAGLPVTFRLLDAGGDKPIEALGIQREANPFLGYRSIRLSLSRPEILETQLRALLRASVRGPVRILVPMISGIEEIREVKRILGEIQSELSAKGIPYDSQIPVGVMVEVPSAVALAHLLVRDCDFLSIGTNDLIQYTLAVDRNNEQVAKFFEPLHPAVLASIARVAEAGMGAGKPVAICGEIAGDPLMTPLLIGLGVTGLSMIPANIPLVKNIVLELNYSEVREVARKAILASTVEEVKALVAQITPPSEERNGTELWTSDPIPARP
jgi:phosphotransferase system enzyme I (PtsP)